MTEGLVLADTLAFYPSTASGPYLGSRLGQRWTIATGNQRPLTPMASKEARREVDWRSQDGGIGNNKF